MAFSFRPAGNRRARVNDNFFIVKYFDKIFIAMLTPINLSGALKLLAIKRHV
jgi:hypothetical protein